MISSDASLDSSASFLTSFATTAKPFPASPALADSIEAFSARRLVCSEILVTTVIKLDIFSTFLFKS